MNNEKLEAGLASDLNRELYTFYDEWGEWLWDKLKHAAHLKNDKKKA